MLRSSRGNFDPEIFHQINSKQYDGDLYYDLANGGLRIPTWFGIDVEGGLQQNEGNYINPENFLPDDGLWYAGLTIPVGRGLFIDERKGRSQEGEDLSRNYQRLNSSLC